MINKIFHDIDECLLHTMLEEPDQNHISFNINDGNTYYTIVRPEAKRLIEFSRSLVGKDNVYILTSSTEDYANKINELAGFGFDKDHIITREEIERHYWSGAYGGGGTCEKEGIAHKDNVLIDNLPPRYNESKMSLIGIHSNRYFQTEEYYGVNFPDDSFEEDVKKFLLDKMAD